MAFNPTPEQERWLAAASRLRLGSGHPWIAERIDGWAAPSFIARCAFFVLGTVAGSLVAAIFSLLHTQNALIPAGLLMLAAAEGLILGKHLFNAGIEEALWTVGLLMVVLQWVAPDFGSGTSSAVLAALALGLAGFRLLNPLFLTCAAVVASLAIDLAGGHRLIWQTDVALPASLFCFGVAAIALAAGGMTFRRPSHDRMLGWLTVLMPLAGFLWLAAQAAVSLRVFTGIACAAFGVSALIIGLHRRAHAPLIACIVCTLCVTYQLRDLTALPVKAKLILWGSVALLLALGLERYLRTPRRGITSRQIGEGGNALDLLQWVGTASLAPKAAPVDAPFKGGGGSFGGGGADGSY
jgi:uncharacterized membrane protein YgcG